VARSRDGDPFALADFHVAQGRLDIAESELRGLLDAIPGSDAARLRLARVLGRQGRGPEAERILDVIIKRDGRDATPWIVLGEARLADHHLDQAARAFAAAFHADPTSIEALTSLTAIDVNAGRVDGAVARVESVLASSPDSVPVLLLAARLHESIGTHDRAEAHLTHAIQVAPSELSA
jgi:predicted Zn-dependent protease